MALKTWTRTGQTDTHTQTDGTENITIGVNFVIKLGGGAHDNDGSLATESPAGSTGRAPGDGEAESISSPRSANVAQICPFLLPCKLLKYAFWKNIVAFSC